MDKVLTDQRLHPVVRDLALKLQESILQKHNVRILYTQGYRSNEYQDSLYEQGRSKPGKIVTNSKGGHSYHNYGLAVDFVPLVNGKAAWNRIDLFDLAGKEALKIGFSWGGNWKKFVDKPHLEKNFGLTIADLLAGKRPPGTPTAS